MTHTMLRSISFFMICLVLFASCSSATMIRSTPPNAKLYLDDEYVGTTPFQMRDTKVVTTCTDVRLEKEGYQTFRTEICKDEEVHVGAIIAGIFLWVPLAWAMKYKAVHHYEMQPLNEDDSSKKMNSEKNVTTPVKQESGSMTSDKAARLRELKALYDDGILSKEEFEKEKKKILEEK